MEQRSRSKLEFALEFRGKYTQGFPAMQEIKPDQRWHEGLDEVQVINAFGVRIVIRPNGTDADQEITEDDFRRRYRFVADH